MAAYLANFAARLATPPVPERVVTGFQSFVDKGLTACVVDSSIQTNFMAQVWPGVTIQKFSPHGNRDILKAILNGTCAGGVANEVLLRYEMVTMDQAGLFCSISYAGDASAQSYAYALPVTTNKTRLPDSVLEAINIAILKVNSNGSYAANALPYIPPQRSPQQCAAYSQGVVTAEQAVLGAAPLTSLDMSGIFILLAVGIIAGLLTNLGTRAFEAWSMRRHRNKVKGLPTTKTDDAIAGALVKLGLRRSSTLTMEEPAGCADEQDEVEAAEAEAGPPAAAARGARPPEFEAAVSDAANPLATEQLNVAMQAAPHSSVHIHAPRVASSSLKEPLHHGRFISQALHPTSDRDAAIVEALLHLNTNISYIMEVQKQQARELKALQKPPAFADSARHAGAAPAPAEPSPGGTAARMRLQNAVRNAALLSRLPPGAQADILSGRNGDLSSSLI